MKLILIIVFLLFAISVGAQECPPTIPQFTFNYYGLVMQGVVLGSVNACDEDFNTVFTWDITQGNENNLFGIENGSIYALNVNKINKDTASYHLTIQVTDNGIYPERLSQTALIDIIMVRNLEVLVYPNPFVDQFVIRYYIAQEAKVMLRIFDARGKLVVKAVDAHENAGMHEITITSLVAPGIYFYELIVDKSMSSGKIMKAMR